MSISLTPADASPLTKASNAIWEWHARAYSDALDKQICGLEPPSQPVDTSEDAADSMKVVAGSMRGKALIWIMSRGSAGSTVDEAEAALGMRHQTISARFYELEYARCLARGEDTRITRSGRKARVYRVTPLGEIRAKMAMEGSRR